LHKCSVRGDSYKDSFKDKLAVQKTGITKISSGKKRITLKWNKDNNTDGYQIHYSTSKKFKKAKTVTVKGSKKTKTTLKKLKKGKKYYVRIRAYKTINGKKYYFIWSKKKSVKIK